MRAAALDAVSESLNTSGMILRGGFNFGTNEDAPAGPKGRRAASVLLVGQAGAPPWPHFQRWRAGQPIDLADPLDSFSRHVIGTVAAKVSARAVSPSDRPFLPFQSWAMRAEGLHPSPLGILMHPKYGLWHAYRGALLFDHEIAIQTPQDVIHLCDLCVGKPCMKACPVDAHTGTGFAYHSCIDHVRGPTGAPCRDGGCLDRNACPHGTHYRYPAEVQAFHMAAFLG
ncbi:hypothetical protein GA830_15995 [Mesorhizobium sp. NBSH29]|uniref:4Fe-4S dicluster domain-containing protein n=1 Tax=Mesorhizobium sp. NBSH29 TaxID=2654249 RepID=UPI00189647D7|nr:4Fe-4S dicluster domain-containing protein [Mesorhizobium sp. NBSH29]QPC88757.1 hypothetical protein GA830_15995 [Mesorhizobium sp. NBSH29]